MKPKGSWWLVVLGIALVTAVLLPFASPLPDGLERVAETLGFVEREQPIYKAPFHDYALPGLESKVGEIIAVLFGLALTTSVVLLLGKLLQRKSSHSGQQ